MYIISSQGLALVIAAIALILLTLYIMRRRVRQGKRVGKF
jgi:hypothetical protein